MHGDIGQKPIFLVLRNRNDRLHVVDVGHIAACQGVVELLHYGRLAPVHPKDPFVLALQALE